ncbi:MAG TPA: VacJ family lipoprotein [Paracoccaceae bacterium]|nr:VacJ family lipoprotein [Paracoccaceae bacterium]
MTNCIRSGSRAVGPLAVLALLGACADLPQDGSLIADPYERLNRDFHEFNKGFDGVILRPASRLYVTVTPELIRFLIANGVANLELPVDALNLFLQGKLELALITVGRFGFNTVFGAAGLLDPATDFGLKRYNTDFGETLHVWGAKEGAYVELPLLGPSTERDTVGRVVDFVLSPTTYITGSPEAETILVLRAADIVGDRAAATSELDPILYDSPDSYTELKTTYVQFRRRQLSGAPDDSALPEIFEEEPAAPSE